MSVKAYFLTWTTYGTWLPGDERGWVDRHRQHGDISEPPDPLLEAIAANAMTEDAVTLPKDLREVVRKAMMETIAFRGWFLRELRVRSNHVHVVITATDATAGQVMGTFKSYASRALNRAATAQRKHWWTHDGSKRKLHTDEAIRAAVQYVGDQDKAWMKKFG